MVSLGKETEAGYGVGEVKEPSTMARRQILREKSSQLNAFHTLGDTMNANFLLLGRVKGLPSFPVSTQDHRC
jgi:hypothetical protein